MRTIGQCEVALELMCDRALERRIFGRPLADVSAIKVVAGRLQTRVLDRAIQLFGAMGLTPDTPRADRWTWGRALRFADGPDEVHLRTVARDELGRARENPRRSIPYCTLPERLG